MVTTRINYSLDFDRVQHVSSTSIYKRYSVKVIFKLSIVILVYFVFLSEFLDRWACFLDILIKEKGIEQNVDVVTPYFFILGELRDMLYLPIPTQKKKI